MLRALINAMGCSVLLTIVFGLLVCCVTALALPDSTVAPVTESRPDAGAGADAEAARTGHRAGMIFPLLLAISRRLAALVPTAFMTLAAIGAMLLFAKKAFLLAAAALFVSLYDHQRAKKKSNKYTYIPYTPYSTSHDSHDVSEVKYYKLPASYYKKPTSTVNKDPTDEYHTIEDNYQGHGNDNGYDLTDDYLGVHTQHQQNIVGGALEEEASHTRREPFLPLEPAHLLHEAQQLHQQNLQRKQAEKVHQQQQHSSSDSFHAVYPYIRATPHMPFSPGR